MNQPFIHPLADVQSANIGVGTPVWQLVATFIGISILYNLIKLLQHQYIHNL